MNNKVALITGASKGIGFEIGRQLGRQGITVLLAARVKVKAEDAAAQLQEENIDAHAVELDVTNIEHIKAVVQQIEAEYGRLDILVNNAGTYLDHLGTDTDVMRQTYEVNVFGAHALTEALLHLLKASPEGRIVNQTSILGSVGTITSNDLYAQASAPAYTSSKAALNALTAQLSIRLDGTNVKANACHPGWVKTDMGGKDAPMEIHEGAETAVFLATLPSDGPTGGFYHKSDVLPW